MADETNTTPDSAPQGLPETVNVQDAAALLDNIDSGDDAAPPKPPTSDEPDLGNAQPEGNEVVPDDGVADDVELPPEDDQPIEEDASRLNDAPSFWSAEDKAAWATIPPQLRPLIHKYEQQRLEHVKSKEREAATIRQEAIDYAKQAADVVTKGAEWWQANGPNFFKAFGDRWAQVDWNTLASENPAEWARLKQMHEAEGHMLRQAHERGQQDIAAAQRREQAQIEERKRSSHEQVARDLPNLFGTPERATKTYDTLGKYLLEQGIDAPRINAIHEAPIIKLAAKAWLYDQAKSRASTVAMSNGAGAANTPGARTPLRVAPGPAPRAANQGGERQRQASERIRKGGSVSIQEAAALMSSLKL
jgi:hypothetical protein